MKTKQKLSTKNTITWCPGCANHMILEAAKKAISRLIDSGFAKQEQFAMTTGIGCHAKMYDYININGILFSHDLINGSNLWDGQLGMDIVTKFVVRDADNDGIKEIINTFSEQ